MQDQLEQELRRLITKFEADVRLAVLRNVHSAFTRTLDPGTDRVARDADESPRAAVRPLPAPRGRARQTLTPEERMAVRVKLTALIRQQPGKSAGELARIVGIPAGTLRRSLRELVEDRTIEVEQKAGAGFQRYTYRATERPAHHAEPLALTAGALA